MGKRIFAGMLLVILVMSLIAGCAVDPNKYLSDRMKRILSGAPFSAGWTGIDVAYIHDAGFMKVSHTIVKVVENSPASRAGIKVGDQIWFVGSENTGYIDTPTVAKKLMDANPAVVIKVKREGYDKLLSFTVKRNESIASRRMGDLFGSASISSAGQATRLSPAEPLPEPPAPVPQRSASPDLIALLGQGPKENAQWGFAPGKGTGKGVTVKRVGKGTPADTAGLVAGDVLLSVDNTPIENFKDWLVKLNEFPLFTPLALRVQRNEQIMDASISLTGRLRLEVKPIRSDFVIPSVSASHAPAPTAIDALEAFNVLDRVFLDPDNGKIAVLGHYDPRFATGSIPYLDLLKTALVHPLPHMDIRPTPESAKLLRDIKAETTVKLRRFPFNEAVDLVQGHPAAERDRQLLIRQLARRYGLAPEEFAAWYNFARIDVSNDSYPGILPPVPLRPIIPLAYINMGYPVAAAALELLYKETPESTLDALQTLGMSAAAGQGPEAYGEQTMQAFLAVAVRVGALSSATRDSLIGIYEKKRMTWQDVVRVSESVMPFTPKGGKLDFMRLAFNHIVLSDPIGLLMFPQVKQARSYMHPTDLDRDSQLTRIMFAADYVLKSTSEYPELFANSMPDFQSLAEFRVHSQTRGDARSDRIWLEPEDVGMNISPDHHVIEFTHSRIRVKTSSFSEVINFEGADTDQPDPYTTWLCRHMMDNYDQYAHIMPPLHEVREAAKVIALAQWLNKENINVNLNDVTQTDWQSPKPFPLLGLISQSNTIFPDGHAQIDTYLTTEGGVVFRPMGSWTTMTPAPQSETKAMDALSLSASLGRQAEVAVQSGDLETARHLADLSAQAMSGSLTRADLPKYNITIPPAPANPGTLSPAAVQSQKEAIQHVYREIAGRNTGKVPVASAPVASNFLHQLQTGQTMPAPAPLPEVPHASPPASTDHNACSISLGPTETVPEDQRAYLDDKLAEAQNRLGYINEALKKLMALNQSQRDQIDQLTDQISKDYRAATERAYDFAVSLLTDLPLAKYADAQKVNLARMEKYIAKKSLERATPMSADALKALERDIEKMAALKDQDTKAVEALERMLAVYSGAQYGSDIDKWDQGTRTSGDRQRSLDAILLAGKILLDHPWLEKMLSHQDWFGGNALWQVTAIGKMAWTASDFFWDIMHQYAAWGPLSAELQKDLKANNAAMEKLRLKAKENVREIQCLKDLMRR
jgi:membrane-associated protease RseP (regulator of RpoE activity)